LSLLDAEALRDRQGPPRTTIDKVALDAKERRSARMTLGVRQRAKCKTLTFMRLKSGNFYSLLTPF
jgi:hypothetical protein